MQSLIVFYCAFIHQIVLAVISILAVPYNSACLYLINIYFPPDLLSQFIKYIVHGVTYEYQMGQGEARVRRHEESVNLNMVCSRKNTSSEKKSKRYRSTNKVFLELETCTAPPRLTHSILSTSPSFSNSSRMGSPSYMAPAPRAVPRHRRSD